MCMWWVVKDVPGIDGVLKVLSDRVGMRSISSPQLNLFADVYDVEAWENEGLFSHKGVYLTTFIPLDKLLEWAIEKGYARVTAGDMRLSEYQYREDKQ